MAGPLPIPEDREEEDRWNLGPEEGTGWVILAPPPPHTHTHTRHPSVDPAGREGQASLSVCTRRPISL